MLSIESVAYLRTLYPSNGNRFVRSERQNAAERIWPNPAWSSLPENRREDLARRMAIFAASVEHIDLGVGKIVADLKANGEFENTLILFTSDNGACYEWGPFGFDGTSRRGVTILHSACTSIFVTREALRVL